MSDEHLSDPADDDAPESGPVPYFDVLEAVEPPDVWPLVERRMQARAAATNGQAPNGRTARTDDGRVVPAEPLVLDQPRRTRDRRRSRRWPTMAAMAIVVVLALVAGAVVLTRAPGDDGSVTADGPRLPDRTGADDGVAVSTETPADPGPELAVNAEWVQEQPSGLGLPTDGSVIRIERLDSGLWAIAGGRPYRSTDGGRTWDPVAEDALGPMPTDRDEPHAIAGIPVEHEGTMLLLGTNLGPEPDLPWTDDCVPGASCAGPPPFFGTAEGPCKDGCVSMPAGDCTPEMGCIYDDDQCVDGCLTSANALLQNTIRTSTPVVWTSSDGGQIWRDDAVPLSGGLDEHWVGMITTSAGFALLSFGYAGTQTPGWHLLTSPDGREWQRIAAPELDAGTGGTPAITTFSSLGDRLVAMGASHSRSGSAAAWYSDDNGVTWTEATIDSDVEPSNVSQMTDLAVGPDGMLAIGKRGPAGLGIEASLSAGGEQMGVWFSEDGATWTERTPLGEDKHIRWGEVTWGPAGFLVSWDDYGADATTHGTVVSLDGVEWTTIDHPEGRESVDVAATDDEYVMIAGTSETGEPAIELWRLPVG
ncbi:MAG: hypothetical protein S0880_36610 [Actinomycetota bacterium]|nr:hypothetical protein [Actinomycetota bacterium]